MNINLKKFLHRGLLFGGFGPIIAGVIYYMISLSIENFSLSGSEVLIGIISTYLLAFLQSGASVFNQIESWPIGKSLFFHFLTIYLAYTVCYLVNTWIPFDWKVILIFSAIFTVAYFIIWFSVFISIKITSKKLNKTIK